MSLPRSATGPKKAKGASDDTGEEEEEERVGWSVRLAYTKWTRERGGEEAKKSNQPVWALDSTFFEGCTKQTMAFLPKLFLVFEPEQNYFLLGECNVGIHANSLSLLPHLPIKGLQKTSVARARSLKKKWGEKRERGITYSLGVGLQKQTKWKENDRNFSSPFQLYSLIFFFDVFSVPQQTLFFQLPKKACLARL